MSTEDAIKVLEEEHRIVDHRNFDRCAKINLALDIAIKALRKELYKEEKKKKKEEKKKKKEEKKKKKEEKKKKKKEKKEKKKEGC